MDEKTKALVEAAEKMAEAARPGPWWLSGGFVRAPAPNTDLPALVDIADGMLTEDAAFIAAARSDIPALCAAVREMDAELERLRKERATEREAWLAYAQAREDTALACDHNDIEGGPDGAGERWRKAIETLVGCGVSKDILG